MLERNSQIQSQPLAETWPSLPLESWRDTYATLHMWVQIIGKIKVELCPHINHWWEVPLYVSTRGLTTSPIPCHGQIFEINLDFVDHMLAIIMSDGRTFELALTPMSVATFYERLFSLLSSAGIDVKINTKPQEVENPIPFEQDHQHASYDAEFANRHWRILVQADRLMKQFRSGFLGKVSPVHFFWGSFDLAVTRFSGRKAPERKADFITREAYSHECSSCGFWPGSSNIQGPAFYAYAAPEPEGYAQSSILPKSAFYNPPTSGFILMYDEVRKCDDPDRMVLDFFQSTYEFAAQLGNWDQSVLEKPYFTRDRLH